jgi:hypothetical protein
VSYVTNIKEIESQPLNEVEHEGAHLIRQAEHQKVENGERAEGKGTAGDCKKPRGTLTTVYAQMQQMNDTIAKLNDAAR